MNTHNQQILAALKLGESMPRIEALERWSCFRLGARVHDLKHGTYDGTHYDIETLWEKNADGKERHAR